MDIAERALAAHASAEKAKQLQKESETLRQRGIAIEAIAQAAEGLGLTIDPDSVQLESAYAQTWAATVPVDDDARLVIRRHNVERRVEMRIKVCDQVYWDLPPGELERHVGRGGTYGCFSTSNVTSKSIETLADLGWAITRVRLARERWCKKHGCRDYWNMPAAELRSAWKEVDAENYDDDAVGEKVERLNFVEDAILQRIGAPDDASGDAPDWQAKIRAWASCESCEEVT